MLAEPVGIHALRSPPERIEHGLHRGVDAEGRHPGYQVVVEHFGVLDAVTPAADQVGPTTAAASSKPRTTVSMVASPIAWKPACSPARAHATTWSRTWPP